MFWRSTFSDHFICMLCCSSLVFSFTCWHFWSARIHNNAVDFFVIRDCCNSSEVLILECGPMPNVTDGRPAEYRWRPVFNAANSKFGWRPLLECRAVTLPRRETRWNLLGCPKLANKSQPLVGRRSPCCKDMWQRYCCLTSFFRLSIHMPYLQRYSPTNLRRWRFFASCIFSEPRAAHFRHAF